VTDDKSLPKTVRKHFQVKHVPHLSHRAKFVKLCDKLYNLRDLIHNPPPGYPLERIQGYCTWARLVLDGARGTNAALEKALDEEIFKANFVFKGVSYPCCPDVISEEHVFPTETTYAT
jgi:guanosine-3',5'-bis(diphosphate) 3'-pyrophosphohydrolase